MKWKNGWGNMRVNLKGLHWTLAKLADGSAKTYWYAWRGGPRLQDDPGTAEFVASYNAAVATKVTAPEGRLPSLLQGYQKSQKFSVCGSEHAKITSNKSRRSWNAYNGTEIRLRQSKSVGRRRRLVSVVIPVGAPLKAALDQAAKSKKSPIILLNSEGRPWIEDGFRASFNKARDKAGVVGLTFNDLRVRRSRDWRWKATRKHRL